MNILSHAVDALIDQAVNRQLEQGFTAMQHSKPCVFEPTIAITTEIRTTAAGDKASRSIAICIADNGSGLAVDDLARIRESFSVKKRAEKETSLAVSYQIITAKHGGKFNLHSRSTDSSTPETSIGGTARNPTPEALSNQNFATGTAFELLLPLV